MTWRVSENAIFRPVDPSVARLAPELDEHFLASTRFGQRYPSSVIQPPESLGDLVLGRLGIRKTKWSKLVERPLEPLSRRGRKCCQHSHPCGCRPTGKRQCPGIHVFVVQG